MGVRLTVVDGGKKPEKKYFSQSQCRTGAGGKGGFSDSGPRQKTGMGPLDAHFKILLFLK